MLQRWFHAKGLFKRLRMLNPILVIEASQLHVLGDSGWSFRETLPQRCLACGQANGEHSDGRPCATPARHRIKI
jgi:hypothetical protein